MLKGTINLQFQDQLTWSSEPIVLESKPLMYLYFLSFTFDPRLRNYPNFLPALSPTLTPNSHLVDSSWLQSPANPYVCTCTALQSTALYYYLLCSTTLHFTLLHFTLLCCTVLSCTVHDLHNCSIFTALYFTVLHFSKHIESVIDRLTHTA